MNLKDYKLYIEYFTNSHFDYKTVASINQLIPTNLGIIDFEIYYHGSNILNAAYFPHNQVLKFYIKATHSNNSTIHHMRIPHTANISAKKVLSHFLQYAPAGGEYNFETVICLQHTISDIFGKYDEPK